MKSNSQDSTFDYGTMSVFDETHRSMILQPLESSNKNSITYLLNSLAIIKEKKSLANKFDGLIIGTGEADFTKGNVVYEFIDNERPFQLLDVPGIEGDESKYEPIVEQAVAKAHLVFYINGTNKKPEVETAKKIKHYLRRDASVFAICNVKGKGDSYEFPEDREKLDVKNVVKAKRQTREVLENVVGKEHLLGVESVQGLVAFSSLAVNDLGYSTIHNSRQNDLLKAQKGYMKNFNGITEMRSFSKIDAISDVIRAKLDTYKEDIIESNKKKLIRLISDNIERLSVMFEEQKKITENVKKEFFNCEDNIKKSIASFKTSITNKRDQALNKMFTSIEDGVCNIIRDNFKHKDQIEGLASQLVEKQKIKFAENIKKIQIETTTHFNNQVDTAIQRLKENIQRVHFQQELSQKTMSGLSLSNALEALNLDMKEIGGILFNIGSYAFAGFGIGSLFPGLGNIIGALVGAVIGSISSALNFFFGGKDKKIRKAQSRAIDSIQDAKKKFTPKYKSETKKIVSAVEMNINENIFSIFKSEITKMENVLHILGKQIDKISTFKKEMEDRPYGSL